MRAIVLAGLSMVVLAGGLALAVDPPGPVELLLPPRGEAAAAWMPDGLPVFVVHDEEGAVHVVDARNPHVPAWSKVVGWCPSAGMFEDPWHGSRFTPRGEWVGGPAPHGLTPFQARLGDGVILVDGVGTPPPRRSVYRNGHAVVPEFRPRGFSCLEGRTVADVVDAGLVVHRTRRPGPVPSVAEIADEPDGWTVAQGAILGVGGEPTRLCRDAGGDPPRCRGQVRWPGAGITPVWDDVTWTRYQGRLLVRQVGGRVQEVMALADGELEWGVVEPHGR